MMDVVAFVALLTFLFLELPSDSIWRQAQKKAWLVFVFVAIGASALPLLALWGWHV